MRSVVTAAANNAAWCDAIAATHGLTGVWNADAWTCPVRTPPLYPDAVTLRAGMDERDLLERVDDSPGCSIKDSFATLDLHPHGFQVLFDAQWITRAGRDAGAAPPQWTRVEDGETFAAWVAAWMVAAGSPGISPLRRELLERPDIAVIAAADGATIEAGAILNRTADAVGVSNVFTVRRAPVAAWTAIPGVAASCFPDAAALCGYESGADLTLALEAGFELLGPLRVWLRSV